MAVNLLKKIYSQNLTKHKNLASIYGLIIF